MRDSAWIVHSYYSCTRADKPISHYISYDLSSDCYAIDESEIATGIHIDIAVGVYTASKVERWTVVELKISSREDAELEDWYQIVVEASSKLDLHTGVCGGCRGEVICLSYYSETSIWAI